MNKKKLKIKINKNINSLYKKDYSKIFLYNINS